MRVLKISPIPREGGEPLRADLLGRDGKWFIIEWGSELVGEGCETVSRFLSYERALEEWYVFPRDQEEDVEKFRRKRR